MVFDHGETTTLIHKLIPLASCQALKISNKYHFDGSESVLDNRRWIHVVLMRGLDTFRCQRCHYSPPDTRIQQDESTISSHPRMPPT
jgi:hypothetical protein